MTKNSEFKPVKLRLKIDLVSYPARAEGLVNMINETCFAKSEHFETSSEDETHQQRWWCPRGAMVKAMDSRIVVSEFEFQSRYYSDKYP